MAALMRSIETAPHEVGDPWDWDVDQVVEALCHRRSPLLGPDDFRKEYPDSDELERIIRSNSVGGLALLTDLNNATMREDLEIKQFGHRCSITHLVRLLRRHSSKWLAHHQAETADNYLSGYGGASNAPQDAGPSPFPRSPSTRVQGYPPYSSLNNHVAFGPSLRTESWVQGQHGQTGELSPNQCLVGLSPRNVLQEAPKLPHPDHPLTAAGMPLGKGINTGMKVGKEDGINGLSGSGEHSADSETQKDTNLPIELSTPGDDLKERRGETFVVDPSGRKRRKLLLGPAESIVAATDGHNREAGAFVTISASPKQESQNNGIVSEDTVVELDESGSRVIIADDGPLATHEPEVEVGAARPVPIPEAGAVVLDAGGRKRMRPILLTQLAEETIEMATTTSNVTSTPQKHNRPAKHIYSGTKAWPVDQIFYGDTHLGQPLENEVNFARPVLSVGMVDHPENFVISSKRGIGNGQRLYANNRMRHFFHSSQHEILHRRGQTVYVVVPYPDKLVRKHQPLSMTEFKETSEGFTVSRRNRSELAANGRHPVPDLGSDATLFNVPEVTMGTTSVDAQDPDFLEKWKYQDGEDVVLPLFGDSGSEGEYDLETWREMEDEHGKLPRPPSNSKSKKIGHDAVSEAIDLAIEKIEDEWRSKRSPKLQVKGWRLWKQCTKDGSKRHRIGELTHTVASLGDRLTNLRNEILGEAWPSAKHVTKQCKILQPSVYDREDCKWKMSILKLKRPPEKPQQTPKLQKPKMPKVEEEPLEDGEEVLKSEDSAFYTSDDDLEDFIVDDDDDIGQVANMDVTMADAEDEGASDTVNLGSVTSLNQASSVRARSATPEQTPKNLPRKWEPTSSKNPLPKASLEQESVYIDLTQASDPAEREESNPKPEPMSPYTIRTPPLIAMEDSSDDSGPKCQKPAEFKRPPVAPEIIDLESDTAEEDELPLAQTSLPGLQNYEEISQLPVRLLEERQDRKRLLIWTLSKYKSSQRQSALNIIRGMSFHDMQLHVWKALGTYKAHGWHIRGYDSNLSDSLMLVAAFYVCWTVPVRLDPKGGIRVDHLATAIADEEGFDPFYHFLAECLSRFETLLEPQAVLIDPEISATPTENRIIELSQDSDPGTYATPQKKRKYMVHESQEAKDLRSNAQLRAQELERRKKTLKLRYQNIGLNDEDPSKVVVNAGKEEGQEFIYLNPKIGKRIQPHQKDGVQFMWRELTTDPKNLQGCLLAHTMGLGKTMQVITVLVTIAEAAKSSNANIRGQVPEPLRTSQTLVVCPPSLVENWYEEFLIWAPDPMEGNVGDIRKVTSAMTPPQRITEIKDWRDGGGVLLMGFNTFRALVGNAGKRLSEAEHEIILHALLEKPNLIVADEAHTAKNLKSKLNVAMTRLKSTSRIGLTGSPLANNLDEYYSLIDWIAPNYLGDHVQFKAHYAEPIQQGFYKDSTTADYLESRKRLKALITDLEPKVHRADITVLKGKLKGKTEFLIRVPLTKLQMELYREYVDWMLGVARAEEPKSTLLWAWLGELRLLCNHPKCYRERLEEKLAVRNGKAEALEAQKQADRKNKRKKVRSAESDMLSSEDEAEILNGAAGGPQVSTTMMEKQLAIMKQLSGPLSSVTQAYKMQILDQILMLAKEANDKTLIFSHSLKTLNYLRDRLHKKGEKFMRIDGSVLTSLRQSITKDFNNGSVDVCLISTRAGGQGLNMFGANRVVILDTAFNPIWEEQAIGRAYRIGQQKPVYVYRLTIGGTFEEALLNQSVFKQQLATRVVDKKNLMRYATKGAKQYLFQPKDLEQKELESFVGKDPLVLDRLLDKYKEYVPCTQRTTRMLTQPVTQ